MFSKNNLTRRFSQSTAYLQSMPIRIIKSAK